MSRQFSTVVFLGVFITLILGCDASKAPSSISGSDLSPADYEAAANLLIPKLQGLVRNESVQPHWIGHTGQFWYRRDGENGPEFLVVSAKGDKTPAFDHEAIAKALNQLTGAQRSGKGLPDTLTNVRINDDLTKLSAVLRETSSPKKVRTISGDELIPPPEDLVEQIVDCDLKKKQCQLSDGTAPRVDLSGMLVSQDGRQAILTRNNNLFLLNLTTGDERALTNDGEPSFAWAKEPFYLSFRTLEKSLAVGAGTFPARTKWSPDGRYVIAPRFDERGVGLYPFIEWIPSSGSYRRPVVHNVPLPLPGDKKGTEVEYYLFDLTSGERTAIQLPKDFPDLTWADRGWPPVYGWSQTHNQAFILAKSLGWKAGALFRVDLATGKASEVIKESAATRFELSPSGPPNVRLIGDGREVIWYSGRTGWGHLYLYDAQTGRLKYPITSGEWAVQKILAVDEQNRDIYFAAQGREVGQDPYYRQLYRARLGDDRAEVIQLTEANADHHKLFIHPTAGVFVSTWSTVDKSPVSELRSANDGQLIAQLEMADASRLYLAGWEPPKRERVKAADGTTDLYAVYYSPFGQTAGKKYPVIDPAYNGASSLLTPRNFLQAYQSVFGNHASAMTRLGFAVVIVDGRGTAGRSSAFRDAGYPAFTQVGVDDHVAAISELGGRYPEMDTERVGVWGTSWGGNFAAQAIMTRPEFYKVAVSAAGGYDYAALEPSYDQYIGLPVYADGSPYRSRPDEAPTNWDEVKIVDMVDGLQGELLIVYSDFDVQAKANQVFLLIDALTRADKPYDLIAVPRGHHGQVFCPYVMKRMWNYFVEHLHGAEPVRDFRFDDQVWAAYGGGTCGF